MSVIHRRPRRAVLPAVAALLLCLAPRALLAQSGQAQRAANLVDGSVSAMVDVLPDVSPEAGRQQATELRLRVLVERTQDVGAHLRLRGAVFVDGLVADRRDMGGTGTTRAAIVRPNELYAEWRTDRFEVRAGASRLVWGRLDEFQPGDVVNPLDTARFLLEGRSEARLAVAMVRPRLFLPQGWVLEGVVVPRFRSGRADQLDEATSPFTIGALRRGFCADGPASCITLLPVRQEPGAAWRNLQGGGRLTGAVGRVDVGASVYRGFEAFPTLSLGPALPTFAPGRPVHNLYQAFPRFTMMAGDFETVRGPWGLRGEAAWFPEDTLQSDSPLAAVPGRSLEVGVGLDRRAGSYRVSGNVVVSRRRADAGGDAGRRLGAAANTTDTLLVGWAERTFARETRSLRLLAAWNPDARSAFVRAIGSVSLRDNVAVEVSGGWLHGEGRDALSRLSMRDFATARLKVHF